MAAAAASGRGDDDGSIDRISGLHDDLLIQVLVRLRCAGAAARTSVLARRWRGLWRHLPDLSLRGLPHEALEAALAQVALPKLSLLDIDVPSLHRHRFSVKGVASLLRTAGRLDPVELRILMAWVASSAELAVEFYSPPPQRNLQEMFQFPNFTVLELNLRTDGHAYGPMVLNLLSMCTVIERLKLVIVPNTYMKDEKCWPSCPGDQPQNWRSQNISLTSLEEVEIENFKGNVHEVCFLKLLFRGAPLMKVTIKLAFKVAPSSRVCKDIYSIFKANPAVESHVYHENGEEVIYT
ncbi:unnamed protein product [Urochloa decumbens]|uniref:FBD domain-containing protein n=1 Tax=Urochloa decumbens TaxID=240449 RepID=A0ABC9FBZ5_9POAL